MLIVVDTNVFISAVLKSESVPRRVLDFVIVDEGMFLFSDPVLTEYTKKIEHPKFGKERLEERKVFFKEVLKYSLVINITEKITDCRDANDNMFLELAVCGNADYIVSGDKDLCVLNPFRNIPILTPAEFLEKMRMEA